MLFLLAIGVGIAVGALCRGRLAHLSSMRLRRVWILLLALLIQVLIFPLFLPQPLLPYATAPLHLASYAMVLVWILMNLRTRPMWMVGLGGALNLLVLAVNGGYMPVSLDALARAGQASTANHLAATGVYANVIPMSADTRLNVLGDILAMPDWVPLARVLSLGDIAIAVGIAWLIAKGMMGNE